MVVDGVRRYRDVAWKVMVVVIHEGISLLVVVASHLLQVVGVMVILMNEGVGEEGSAGHEADQGEFWDQDDSPDCDVGIEAILLCIWAAAGDNLAMVLVDVDP